MIQAQAELKQAKENLRRQIQDVVVGMEREYEAARANENALAGEVAEAKGTIQGSNRKDFELTALERDVTTIRQIYDMFLGRFKDTSAAGVMQNGVVARVVDPATMADRPAKPKKLQVIFIAFVLGLFLGALVAVLLERLDNTVNRPKMPRSLGMPVLTTVPLLDIEQGQNPAHHYIDEPKSVFSEAVRTARTGILLSAIDCPNKVLVVTSSVPGEGKSTFAINLAISHAQTKKVLLIDADMRRPTVGKTLGLDSGKPGLSMLVSGSATLESCLQTIEGSSLSILTAGAIPPNPLELLLSQKFKETLDALSEQFDVVIIDSPPVQLVSDAVVLSTMATGVFVVKAESTPYQIACRCVRTLRQSCWRTLNRWTTLKRSLLRCLYRLCQQWLRWLHRRVDFRASRHDDLHCHYLPESMMVRDLGAGFASGSCRWYYGCGNDTSCMSGGVKICRRFCRRC
jgi:capsular exopolysaccharide synthesis family protein